MSAPRVRAEGLAFAYPGGDFHLSLEELAVHEGEAVACVGASGSGKTTLVGLLTGVLAPDRGRVELAGQELTALPDAGRRALRLARVGMVFQHFALLEYLRVLDNVLLPYRLSRRLALDDAARERARGLARRTGIEALLGRKPAALSHGERQRVALCRALVTRPALVVADEPTGNLDPHRAREAVDLLVAQTRERGAGLIAVTHDHSLLDRFDRVVRMEELAG